MKKAEYKFHKNAKSQIESNSRQTDPDDLGWLFGQKATNKPIFIPKRKKKK